MKIVIILCLTVSNFYIADLLDRKSAHVQRLLSTIENLSSECKKEVFR